VTAAPPTSARGRPSPTTTRTGSRPRRVRGQAAVAVGKLLAVAPPGVLRFEATELPNQRTRDGQLDRDHGLEMLGRARPRRSRFRFRFENRPQSTASCVHRAPSPAALKTFNLQLYRHCSHRERPIAMQKVEGSSPFSRSSRKPRSGGVFSLLRAPNQRPPDVGDRLVPL
jgi:hypothetical protein